MLMMSQKEIMSNIFFPNATLTGDIYWAAKPPAVRAMREMPSGEARDKLALTLAQSGYLLDAPIDVWNWDAVTTMGVRQQLGFTWVPSALQAPLNGQIGIGPVPPGAIRVSTNAADFPPYDPPVPPPQQSTNLVGWQIFGSIYTFGPGAIVNGQVTVTDGQLVTQSGVQYKAHVNGASMLGMGVTVYFEKVTS
jgi:hypothetical protein